MSGPQARLLPDGRRLHLQHGPIDLVVEAVTAASPPPQEEGDRPRGGEAGNRRPPPPCFAGSASPCGEGDADRVVALAYQAAIARFATILDELCAELPLLRALADPERTALRGLVARRMWAAVAPFAGETFLTPMAAVAGAVAEEVLGAMLEAAPLRRASVNNGGDIALHLAPGESVRIGLVDRPDRCERDGRPSLSGMTTLRAGDGIGGVATSGWRGRSFSLGVADAVTILARTAAEADAAATIVANAVDLPGHPAVGRVPAAELRCDSDLGAIPVTRAVGPLAPREIEAALSRGLAVADDLMARGLIAGAALHLQSRTVVAGLHPRLGRDPFSPCGRRWPGGAGSDEGSPSRLGAHPSSDLASRGHLLPQGEKEPRRAWEIAA